MVHEGIRGCGDAFGRVVVSQSKYKRKIVSEKIKERTMCRAPSPMNVAGGAHLDPSLSIF
jgi:hypothetical protein